MLFVCHGNMWIKTENPLRRNDFLDFENQIYANLYANYRKKALI